MSYSSVPETELNNLLSFIHDFEKAPNEEKQQILHRLAEIVKSQHSQDSPQQLYFNF